MAETSLDISELAPLLREAAFARLDPDSIDSYDERAVRLGLPVARELGRRYFRARVRGLEHVPDGAAMLVGNHNAGITFLEPFVMTAELYERFGTARPLHFIAHDAMVALPLLGNMLLKWGAVRGSHDNARRILAAGRRMVVFPGGNREAFRPFRERYRVDFAGHRGFARLAVELDVPVVPVANVGGHSTFIILRRGERLALALHLDKLIRSKTFPVMLSIPWGLTVGPVFHFPPPVRLDIELGEPIVPSRDLAHVPADGRADALYKSVEGRIQAMIDAIRARRRGT